MTTETCSSKDSSNSRKRRQVCNSNKESSDNGAKTTNYCHPKKKSAVELAVHKRNREKQRRRDLSHNMNVLAAVVTKLDPSLITEQQQHQNNINTLAHQYPRLSSNNTTKRRNNTVTNRTELVQYSIQLLRKLYSGNQEKDDIIAKLTATLEEGSAQQQHKIGGGVLENHKINTTPNIATSLMVATTSEFPSAVAKDGDLARRLLLAAAVQQQQQQQNHHHLTPYGGSLPIYKP